MRQSLYVRSKAEAYSQKRFLAYQMGNQMKAIGISAFLNSMAPCMAQQFLYSIPKFLFAVKEKGISPQPFSDSHDPPKKNSLTLLQQAYTRTCIRFSIVTSILARLPLRFFCQAHKLLKSPITFFGGMLYNRICINMYTAL